MTNSAGIVIFLKWCCVSVHDNSSSWERNSKVYKSTRGWVPQFFGYLAKTPIQIFKNKWMWSLFCVLFFFQLVPKKVRHEPSALLLSSRHITSRHVTSRQLKARTFLRTFLLLLSNFWCFWLFLGTEFNDQTIFLSYALLLLFYTCSQIFVSEFSL